LTSLYPASAINELSAKYTEWDNESLELAKTYVYPGITENTLPSAAYLNAGKIQAERQLVKGGLRLAMQLQTLWGAATEEEAVKEEAFL